VATVAVHREFFPVAAATAVRDIGGWRTLATARPPALGNADAAARVVLFSDFQCPYCRDLEGKLGQALASLGDRIAVVRYDLPLTRVHGHAYAAALAARCARQQGTRERLDALLFQRNLDAPGLDFADLARDSGATDLPAFRACMRDTTTAHGVDADIALAHRLGIEGVPALIVDGKLYSGTMDEESLRDVLSNAL